MFDHYLQLHVLPTIPIHSVYLSLPTEVSAQRLVQHFQNGLEDISNQDQTKERGS